MKPGSRIIYEHSLFFTLFCELLLPLKKIYNYGESLSDFCPEASTNLDAALIIDGFYQT